MTQISRLINENAFNSSPTIGHIDADAYEWQVVCKTYPEYVGKPGIVVNSNSKRTKIVAVSYEARAYGITRQMTVTEARSLCKNLIVHVKEMEYGKPAGRTIRKYSRDIKFAITNYLKRNKMENHVVVDYASNDEFFIDATREINRRIVRELDIANEIRISPATIYLESRRQKFRKDGITFRLAQVHPRFEEKTYQDEVRLLYGAILFSEIVQEIFSVTGFTCSVGVSHNILLAKLACGLNKPNAITVLPLAGVTRVSKKIKISSIPGLGGKDEGGGIGFNLRNRGIHTMHQLQQTPVYLLNRAFRPENVAKLVSWSNGISHDVVQQRLMKLTLSCGKSNANIRDWPQLYKWFGPERLGGELLERLEEERIYNKRRPVKLSLYVGNSRVGEIENFPENFDDNFVLGEIQDILGGLDFEFPITREIKLYVPEFVPI